MTHGTGGCTLTAAVTNSDTRTDSNTTYQASVKSKLVEEKGGERRKERRERGEREEEEEREEDDGR